MTATGSVPPSTDGYEATSIVVLHGLEAVRRHPSMYIGSTDAQGLAQLVFELVDNAVDECEAGHCRRMSVEIGADGRCVVSDDGRGIPTEPHPVLRRPACEVVLTTLHAGGKFQAGPYATTAGLHGVGASCVNALSEELQLDVMRHGRHHRQSFARGAPTSELTVVGVAEGTGTRLAFRPDPTIFGPCDIPGDVVLRRLEEVAFLHPGLTVTYRDERTGHEARLRFDTGVRGFLERRNRDLGKVHPSPLSVTGRQGSLAVDVALQWTDGYAEDIRAFVNTVATHEGGTHVDGLRRAVAEAVNRFARDRDLLGQVPGGRIAGVDVLEGFTAVIAVRLPQPELDGQTKRRLHDPAVGERVRSLVEEAMVGHMEADELLGRKVVDRALAATRARLTSRLVGRAVPGDRRHVRVDHRAYQRQFGVRSRNWHDSCQWLTDEGLLSAHTELYDGPGDARMLDVCCGSGVVGQAFDGRVGEKVGLDITPEMVRLARERLDRVYQGTVYDLPFEEGRFDLVVNREVLHLLPQPARPVAEVFRVLRPGGQFIVGQILPYADEDAFWMYRIFKKKQPLLFNMFREADFRNLLLEAGFVDLRMREHFLWESIDRWIDTHETTPARRQEIYRLYYDAPSEVRAVHPFEVSADGKVRDRWRWCVFSARKPLPPGK